MSGLNTTPKRRSSPDPDAWKATAWQCEGCESLFPRDRKKFLVHGYQKRFDHKKQAWVEARATLCSYCFDNHKRWQGTV